MTETTVTAPFPMRFSVAFTIEIPGDENVSLWWPDPSVPVDLFRHWRSDPCGTDDGYVEHVYGAVLDEQQFDLLVTVTGVECDGESMGILGAEGIREGISPSIVMVDGDHYRVTVTPFPVDADVMGAYGWPDGDWDPMCDWLVARYGGIR